MMFCQLNLFCFDVKSLLLNQSHLHQQLFLLLLLQWMHCIPDEPVVQKTIQTSWSLMLLQSSIQSIYKKLNATQLLLLISENDLYAKILLLRNTSLNVLYVSNIAQTTVLTRLSLCVVAISLAIPASQTGSSAKTRKKRTLHTVRRANHQSQPSQW